MATNLFSYEEAGIYQSTDVMSVSFWHKTTAVPAGVHRFMHGPFNIGPLNSGSDPSALYCGRSDSADEIKFTRPADLTTPYTGVDEDGWMHVVAIFNRFEDTKVYVDGVRYDASGSSPRGWDEAAFGNDRFMIGGRNYSSPESAYALVGSLAHVALFRRELTEAEIEILAVAGRRLFTDVGGSLRNGEIYYPFFIPTQPFPKIVYDGTQNEGYGSPLSTNPPTGSPWGTASIKQDTEIGLSGGDNYLSYLYLPFGEDSDDRPVVSDSDDLLDPTDIDNIHIVLWVHPLDDSHRTLMGTSPVTVTTKNGKSGMEITITDPNDTLTYETVTSPPADGWYFISIKLSKDAAPVLKVNDEELGIVSGSSTGTWFNVAGAFMLGNAVGAAQPGFEGGLNNFAVRRRTFADALLTRMYAARPRITPY